MSINRDQLAQYFGETENDDAPSHLGKRYNEAGTFLSDPGNTVVAHLVSNSATETALLAARQRYLAMADADGLAFTAASSLHMTLFQGVLDRRREQRFWPEGVPLDMPLAEVTALMLAKLDDFAAGPDFSVELVQAVPTGLIVEGASDADREAMAAWRDRFADLFGYRHPDHERYQFHITFAYPIRWIADARLPAWADMLDEVTHTIRKQAPVLELRAPAFCVFEDMNEFRELRVFDRRY